jgi:HK97 gp10 family phage protein
MRECISSSIRWFVATVRIEGLRDLDHALAELPKATAKNVLKRTLIKAAKPIDDEASRLAPHSSGKLATSIITGTRLTRSQKGEGPVLTESGFRSAAKNYVEVYVGTALPRGQFMEFGTFKDAPEPFMTPAWEANKEGALQIIETTLGTEIEKAAARLARKAARA